MTIILKLKRWPKTPKVTPHLLANSNWNIVEIFIQFSMQARFLPRSFLRDNKNSHKKNLPLDPKEVKIYFA